MMKKQFLALIPVAVLGVANVEAVPITFHAILTGANENPANDSLGTGLAIVEYDPLLHTLRVDVEFSGLTGTTTAAHIHCCVDQPGNVGVATQTPSFIGFPLGVTSGTYEQTFDLTLASSWNAPFLATHGGVGGAETVLAQGLADGRSYFNIHSSFRSGGEIRGFLVPEPGTIGLLSIGLATLASSRRKRKG